MSKVEELQAKLAAANAEAAKDEDAHEERALELEIELIHEDEVFRAKDGEHRASYRHRAPTVKARSDFVRPTP